MMVKKSLGILLGVAAWITTAAFADNPDAMFKASTQAKISRAVAERTALAQVPHGSVRSAELEREHGRLIWSFDIAVPNVRDIKEVQIDANDGSVVSVKTETAAQQAEEAVADQREAKKKPRILKP